MISPSALRIEASSHCQLRCPSCPTATDAIRPAISGGFLRPEDFAKLLKVNPQVRLVELSNYGEAFLNPKLLDILRIAHERGVALTLANGANLNHIRPEVLEGLVKYGLRSMLCSIDGASQETYAAYRVRGDFSRVIGNVRAINRFKAQYRSRYPELAWQFVVFGHNEHEIPVARAMAKELGMAFRTKLSWDSRLSPVRNVEFVRKETGSPVVTREEYREKTGRVAFDGICTQLWQQPQLNWDGTVLGCSRNFWGDFGGNAFNDGLVPSVNHPRMQRARAMLAGEMPEDPAIPCTTCEIYRHRKAAGQWIKVEVRPSKSRA